MSFYEDVNLPLDLTGNNPDIDLNKNMTHKVFNFDEDNDDEDDNENEENDNLEDDNNE